MTTNPLKPATHDTACGSDMSATPPSSKRLPVAARQPAQVVREYGPFGRASAVHGVTHDGQRVWAATGEHLVGFDPASGATTRTRREVGSSVFQVFDGQGTVKVGDHQWQVRRGDMFVVPSWQPFTAQCDAGQPSLDLFRFSDTPIFEAVHAWREQIEPA